MALSDRDWDDLKAILDKTVYKVFGFAEPSLVTAALNCIDKGYDKNKTISKLQVMLDEGKAERFADKLFDVWDDFKASSKGTRKKRKDDKEEEPEKKKKRRFVDDDPPPIIPGPGNPSPGQLTADKIKEMMQNAQKAISERKAQLNITVPTPSPMMTEKEKRAAELQAMIQNRMANLSGSGLQALALAGAQGNKPTPLILDAEGRTIDAKTGQAIQIQQYTPTLKANIRAKRREEFKGLIDKPPEEISESKFFDPRVGAKVAGRQRRGFKFHEKGKFESLAGKLRAKAQLDRLQNEILVTARKTGIASAAKLATLAPKKESREGEIPDIEWWDSYLINGNSYDDVDFQKLEGITHLVEHPIQMKPPAEPEKPPELTIFLTKKERKKLRRQNRQEAQKDEQEKIRLGLAPPPEPKVRMANLMRVLGTEAVQDPTKIEQHVRAQMEKRLKQHQEANAARKLTTEQRKEKKKKKIQEDTSLGVNICVYRIRDLTNPAKKFKVETNAKQLYMTGLTVLYKDCNVVVVEGGPKQQRKFKKLMLQRIKWSEDKKKGVKDDDDSDSEDEVDKTNKCVLVWEGMAKSRAFGEMKFKVCPTELFAREQFKKLGVEQYWDLAFTGAVMESTGEDT